MKRTAALVILFTASAASVGSLCGCSAGSRAPLPRPSSTPPAPVVVVPRITIGWGERSRATGRLNSALSAVVRLQGALPDGRDLIFIVNRLDSPGDYAITVKAPSPARIGQWPLAVDFYAESDGAGALVGAAQAIADLPAEGTLPEVTVFATITQVEMTAGQQVPVGQTCDLLWTARARDGALVPVTPGSGRFWLSAGAERLRLRDGQVEGLMPGTALVNVQVDGVSSAPMPVRVTSRAVVTVTPDSAVVPPNGTVDFTAWVSETANQNVVWQLLDVGGGTILSNGRYTAPAATGVYTLRAVSQYDPEKSAVVVVTVRDTAP